MTAGRDEVIAELQRRITDYLTGGGLFNPEMAIHDRVRDLLIDCREALSRVGVREAERDGWVQADTIPPFAIEVYQGCSTIFRREVDETGDYSGRRFVMKIPPIATKEG